METIYHIIGHSSQTLEWWQMTIRAVILFMVAVFLLRMGGNRIFGQHTVVDIVLSVVLGSNFSRALTGNAPFFPVIVATTVLVAVHAGLARLGVRFDIVSAVVKGEKQQLVSDGEILWDKMKEGGVAEGDLKETMRSQGKKDELDNIKDAYLERSGNISIITKD